MSNKNNIAIINPETTCCKCLKESTNLHEIHIEQMGYGSGFDGWSTKLNLCNDCYNNTNSEWWKLEVVSDKSEYRLESYKYENEIFTFVNKMSLAGQELFYNRFATGRNRRNSGTVWEPQDYIDYALGILPHEKCKEHGVYSSNEIRAYKERFPKCQHPVNVIYGDDSKGCRCPFGAMGDYGQVASVNIHDECYGCYHFEERKTPINEISSKDYDEYEVYYKSKINMEKYEKKFESIL